MSAIAETCNRCGGPNVTWSAPSPLWNLVMRGNDINGEPLFGDLVCVPCFVILAAQAGVEGVWRLTVDPEPEGLVKVTPSGRWWDEVANLWRECDHPGIEHGPFSYTGVCPRCRRCKFIGHGPLCGDCYAGR